MGKNQTPISQVLDRAIRINNFIFAIVCAVVCGFAFLISTYVLVLQGGEHIGQHLSLFSVFLPGYSVSRGGAWIGAFWVALFAGVSGAIMYGTYASTLKANLLNQSNESTNSGDNVLIAPIATLSGNALGIGVGIIFGLQLLISTNWLVVRGTASSSDHAALLGYFLPGYTVTFVGSLIGAVEIFVASYLTCRFFAWVYNSVAARHSGSIAK